MLLHNAIAYQIAAADGATHTGLLMLVYDALAADLLRSAQAIIEKDIERRCEASQHALLLLGHLESWIPLLDESRLATSLQAFYSMLRTRILQLQATSDPRDFEDLAQLVCETRAAWQAKEASMLRARAPVDSHPELSDSHNGSLRGQLAGSMSFHA